VDVVVGGDVGGVGVVAVGDTYDVGAAGGGGGADRDRRGCDAVTVPLPRHQGMGAPVDGATEARRVLAGRGERRDPLRRRWGRVGAGVLAAALGGWLFASLYLGADERREVLVLARGVHRLEVVDRSDLRVVRLPTDAEVESIPASRLDDVVGRAAAADLAAGSLLADGQLLSRGERTVGADEAVVGLLLGAGDAPVAGVTRGASVSVVVRAPAGGSGDVEDTAGWVADVGAVVASSGDRPVEVVVPRDAAAGISAAAAGGRVTLVVLGG
jgi:hypothetical protein